MPMSLDHGVQETLRQSGRNLSWKGSETVPENNTMGAGTNQTADHHPAHWLQLSLVLKVYCIAAKQLKQGTRVNAASVSGLVACPNQSVNVDHMWSRGNVKGIKHLPFAPAVPRHETPRRNCVVGEK